MDHQGILVFLAQMVILDIAVFLVGVVFLVQAEFRDTLDQELAVILVILVCLGIVDLAVIREFLVFQG